MGRFFHRKGLWGRPYPGGTQGNLDLVLGLWTHFYGNLVLGPTLLPVPGTPFRDLPKLRNGLGENPFYLPQILFLTYWGHQRGTLTGGPGGTPITPFSQFKPQTQGNPFWVYPFGFNRGVWGLGHFSFHSTRGTKRPGKPLY